MSKSSSWLPFDTGESFDWEPPNIVSATRRADGRLVAAALVVGVTVAIAARSRTTGLGATVCVLAAVIALLWSRRVTHRSGRACIALAAAFGLFLSVRASPWLVPFDVLAVIVLLVVGVGVGRDIQLSDLGLRQLGRLLSWVAIHAPRGIPFLAGSLDRGHPQSERTRSLALGLGLAMPVLLLVGLLLGSADVVFASLFDIGDVGPAIETGCWFAAGTGILGGLLRAASTEREEDIDLGPRSFNPISVMAALSALVVLYAAFVTTQLVALTGGADQVLRTRGVSYAEYARSGFFQLLTVSAITLAALTGLRARVRDGDMHAYLKVLFEIAVVLTLVIVATAISRIELYGDAFGLTTLRLFSEVFALWIGAVFLLVGLRFAGVGRSRAWLAPVSLGLAFGVLAMLNIANPEGIVANENLDRARSSDRFDVEYASRLSDDAVPALVAGLRDLGRADRVELTRALCRRERDVNRSWTEESVARSHAEEALHHVCR